MQREVCEALGVSPGDKLLLMVRGQTVIGPNRPPVLCEGSAGFTKRAYLEGYLPQERVSRD